MTLDNFAQLFNLKGSDLSGLSRRMDIVDVRHLYCYCMKDKGIHETDIGVMINRSRPNTLTSINKIRGLIRIGDKTTLQMMRVVAISATAENNEGID